MKTNDKNTCDFDKAPMSTLPKVWGQSFKAGTGCSNSEHKQRLKEKKKKTTAKTLKIDFGIERRC